jgi:hypothetical protein
MMTVLVRASSSQMDTATTTASKTRGISSGTKKGRRLKLWRSACIPG